MNFQTLYITKDVQFNNNIVITVYELKLLDHRRETIDILSSHELPFMEKAALLLFISYTVKIFYSYLKLWF